MDVSKDNSYSFCLKGESSCGILTSYLLYMLNSKHICPFYVYTG